VFSLLKEVKFYVKYIRTPIFKRFITRESFRAGFCTVTYTGTAVAQWLRCCATNRKFAGSIPDCVIGIFH